MKNLSRWIEENEDWLVERVLLYAGQRNYTKYTSTLEDAWRLSVVELSGTLVSSIREGDPVPELGPDEDYTRDPIASFGMREARRHRSRGVRIDIFLGLMKYYRQAYVDLVRRAGFDGERETLCRHTVERFFDRMEIGFCKEWSAHSESAVLSELQAKNRDLTNEKNRALTIFESFNLPALLLDGEGRIATMNHAAGFLLEARDTPGGNDCGGPLGEPPPAWLREEWDVFESSHRNRHDVEKRVDSPWGPRYYNVSFKRMPDVSDEVSGAMVILYDLTLHRQFEEALAQSEERYRLITQNMSDYVYSATVGPRGEVIPELITGALTRITGYSLEEIQAREEGLFSLIHPEDLERILRLRTVLLGNQPLAVDFRITTKSGETRWLREYIRPIWDEGQGRVARLLGGVQDITERKRLEAELRTLAITDSLTDVLNRRYFLQLVDHEVERSKRYDKPLSILMLDIDHFKLINDTHGHDAGDRVLLALTGLVRSLLRRADIFGRLGGEEFAILLPETDTLGAIQMAERLRRALTDLDVSAESGPISVTVSIGVARLDKDVTSVDTLLKNADRALYAAKRKGRNRVETFDVPPQRRPDRPDA